MSETEHPTPEAAPAPETDAPAPETAVAVAEPPAVAAPAPTVAAPVVEASAPPASVKARGGSVQVPVWLLVVLAVVVVGVGAFFVGRETAPQSDSGPKTLAEAVEQTAAGEMEVGDFDLRSLLQALSRNDDLDLGRLGDLILGGGGGR